VRIFGLAVVMPHAFRSHEREGLFADCGGVSCKKHLFALGGPTLDPSPKGRDVVSGFFEKSDFVMEAFEDR
jgi:hypothetical protein